MKNSGLLWSFLLFTVTALAQFDTPKRTVNIKPLSDPKGQSSPTTSRQITYPSIFDKKDPLLSGVSLLKKKEEESKSIMEKEKFESPNQEYTDRMNKKNDGKILEKYKSDSFLGQFKTGSKVISIACRDHEAPDGDLVRIWLNDRIAIDAILLEVDYKEVRLDLAEGINKIEIEALNQGDSGPNTAQFTVYDQQRGTITANKWNLTTGVKAKLIILKEKTTISQQEE